MLKKIISCILVAVFVTGCASEQYISSTSSRNKNAVDELMFIDYRSAAARLKEHLPKYPLLDEANESLLIKACSEGPTGEEAKALPALAVRILMPLVVTPAINWFVGKVNDKVKDDLQSYTNTVNFTKRTFFYTPVMTSSFSCFRLRRSILVNAEHSEKGEANRETVWDFVGQIKLTDSKDAIQVRPLKLYYSKAFYEKAAEDDKVGVIIGLKADAVWREGNAGKKDTVFNIDTLYQTTRNLKNDEKADYPFLNNPSFVPSDFISDQGVTTDNVLLKKILDRIQEDNLSQEPLPKNDSESVDLISWLNKLIEAPDLHDRVIKNNLKNKLDQNADKKGTKDIIDKYVEGTKDYRKDEKDLTADQKEHIHDLIKNVRVLNRLLLEALCEAPEIIKWDVSAKRLPMIPFSYDMDRKPIVEKKSYLSPPIDITVTVHETGAAPWLLKELATNLDKNQKDIGSALSDYVKKQLTPTSTGKQ